MRRPKSAETSIEQAGPLPVRHVVGLSGAMVVARAEAIRNDLIGAIAQHDRIDIDCSGATDADLTFVQLLIAAQRTAASAGKSVHLLKASAVVERAIEAGGFSRDAIQRSGSIASPLV